MKRLKISILFNFLFFFGYSQKSMDLQNALSDFTSQQEFVHSHIAVSVVKHSSGEEILKHNERLPYIPASSLKLITNLSAVKLLGKDYNYKTEIFYSGLIDYDGTLKGDIVIKAGGDPSLGSDSFKGVRNLEGLCNYIVLALQKKNINCLDGNIVILSDFYAEEGPGATWQWNDIANYYGGGAWSFNINENSYNIYFNTKKPVGEKAELIEISPSIPLVHHSNEVLIDHANSGDQAYVFGDPSSRFRTIKGSLPKGHNRYKIKASLPNPALFFASYLKDKLLEKKIGSQQVLLVKEYNHPLTLIDELTSPSIERIAYISNVESNNLYAECLFKTLPKELSKHNHELNSQEIIIELFKKYNIAYSDYNVVDGSGMSRRNLISCHLMSNFLRHISLDLGYKEIKKLIGNPVKNESLNHLMKPYKSASKFWIKTGSMSMVQSYSGLFQTSDGEWYSFCLMANAFDKSNSQIRKKFDHFLNEIYTLIDSK